nr:TniB family NTP-binding protein [Pectinatus frisingensis]
MEVLRKVDEVLDSKYYQNALRARATTDMLIGSVSQVALNHIGMLVVDEIQNVANSKNGKSLIGALTQLINNSGISICMVGTPESSRFFESAMQLARRSVGLQYTSMSNDNYFQEFCKVMFKYQYVQKRTEITDGILTWLYEHSAGITSVVVALIHDAQEIAILNGKEILNLESLNEAYQQRLSLLHGYIQPSISQGKQTSKIKKKALVPTAMVTDNETLNDCISIADLVDKAKNENMDIVQLLKSNMSVAEVAV